MTEPTSTEPTTPRYVPAPPFQLVTMSRLTAIAWFTGIMALGSVVTAIGTLVLLARLG